MLFVCTYCSALWYQHTFPLLLEIYFIILFYLFIYLFNFCFLGPHPQHMEVPSLGVESELQLLAYATATATQDPSCVCDLHHRSQQRQILNPQSEARGRTCILMDTSQVLNVLSQSGNSKENHLNFHILQPILGCLGQESKES